MRIKRNIGLLGTNQLIISHIHFDGLKNNIGKSDNVNSKPTYRYYNYYLFDIKFTCIELSHASFLSKYDFFYSIPTLMSYHIPNTKPFIYLQVKCHIGEEYNEKLNQTANQV